MSRPVPAEPVAGADRMPTGSLRIAKPRLLFFYSRTSGPSRRVEGFLSQVLQRNGNHNTFDLVRIDVEQRTDLVDRLRITTIPELLVVEGQKIQARIRKPRGAAELTTALAPWLQRRSQPADPTIADSAS